MARPLLYHEGWGWREDGEDGALVKKVALSPVRFSEVKVGRYALDLELDVYFWNRLMYGMEFVMCIYCIYIYIIHILWGLRH